MRFFCCQVYMGLDARKPVVGVCKIKSAYKPAHLRSQNSIFVIRYLESVVVKLAA